MCISQGVCKVLKALKPTKPDMMTFSTKDRIPTLYVRKPKKIQRSKGMLYLHWYTSRPVLFTIRTRTKETEPDITN